tara:strand:- start:7656 stop:8924 length:1269 start_codon:yes stop_codon:yes gene_type:complete
MFCYNSILNRESIKLDIIEKLHFFENNKTNKNIKRGFYISGNNGTGKTNFVKKILNELNYDIIHYTASDIRNKNIIESFTKENMSDINVLSMFNKKKRRIAIIMDEIDGINCGDKGGITSLISIVRQKKTKKQLSEAISHNPIFCISTDEIDKKTKELIKVCNYYEFKKPTKEEIKNIIERTFLNVNDSMKNNIYNYTQNDLRKLNCLRKIYEKDVNVLYNMLNNDIITKKSVIEISKDIVKTLYKKNINIENHNIYINDNERTIVALLWHENICDILNPKTPIKNLIYYQQILNNLCYGDYIDRITFQKQIWQFNELSSFIKIMFNNYIIHNNYTETHYKQSTEIRFTKVLTKYSTEFNNYSFFQNISNLMMLDKRDIISYFIYIKNNTNLENEIIISYELKDLDIQRIYRYIDNQYKINN